MKKDVKLKKLNNNELSLILDIINADRELKNTFKGEENTISRILTSIYCSTIILNNKTIGFVMFVYNNRTSNIEIDMGILEKYKNRGYGTIVLNDLKQLILNQQNKVLVQVKNNNHSAIKVLKKTKFKLDKKDELYTYFTI